MTGAVVVPRVDRCASVAAVLADLSPAGEPLRVEPALAGGTVYARFSGLPPAEIRARFARLLHATWNLRGDGGWTLARTPKDRLEIARIERGTAAASIAAALKTLSPTPAGIDPATRARAYVAALEHDLESPRDREFAGPVDGLLADLLLAFGPDRLAALPAFERVGFSDRPTRRETALPPDGIAAVRRYAETEIAFANAIPEEVANRLTTWRRELVVEAARRAGVSRALLQIERRDVLLRAQLATYDGAGALRSFASLEIPLTTAGEDGAASLPPTGGTPLPEGDGAARAALSGGDPAALRPYLDPVAHDPLELRALPVLRARPEPLLVALPDRVAFGTLGVKDWPSFVAALARGGVALRSEEGWLVGTPISPAAFDRACLDRAELGRWIARGAGIRLPAVRALAELYARGGLPVSASGLKGWYADGPLPRLEGGLRTNTASASLLRALGTLGDDGWEALEAGRKVPVGADPVRRGAIDVWSRDGVIALDPWPGGTEVQYTGTVAFPDGLPGGTTLSLAPRSDPAMLTKEYGWTDPDAYAAFTFGAARDLTEATDEAIGKWAGARAIEWATRGTIVIRAEYGPNRSSSTEVPTDELSGFHKGRYADLPESIRAILRAEVARHIADRASFPQRRP